MQYEFKDEDKQLYNLLENLGISVFLDTFLEKQKETICKSYNSLISQMKSMRKNERHTEFLDSMNCEEFVTMVGYTFKVIFAKDFVKNSKMHNSNLFSILAAMNLAKKMSENPQNIIYIMQLERIILNCSNSIMQVYTSL